MMDRREMVRRLNDWMLSGQDHFASTGRDARGKGPLKSYLVEANAPEEIVRRGGIKEFFSTLELSTPVEILEGVDPTVHAIRIGNRNIEFILDTLDERFWLLHSTESAEQADSAISRLIRNTVKLDSIWLPTQSFEQWITEVGVPRTMTAKFAVSSGMYQDALPEEGFMDDSFVLKIGSTGDVSSRWNTYKGVPFIEAQQALWNARVVRTDLNNARAVVDITASGKATARGNAFLPHDALLRGIISRYRTLITEWESNYRLGWRKSDRAVAPVGEVAEIRWPDAMDETQQDKLVEMMVNCGEPYRLYGVPIKQSSGRYLIKGVDLHTGDRINLELLPDTLWLHLSPNACGNVIARLLTNLQHYHDARTKLYG